MQPKPLAIGLAALLAGGGAIAAFGLRDDHAQVVEVSPVMESREVFAEVVSATPVSDVVSVPRKICNQVPVQRRLPERDGNAGGAIAGALIGGLIGNQVGGGDGRKLATVAGAVAGGYAGREVDRRHVGGRVVADTAQQCHTVSEAREQVVGYEVSYLTEDGRRGEVRTDKKPGDHVSLGLQPSVVGYDVTYRYRDVQRQVRMEHDPGDRLPVVDGKVVLTTDAPLAASERGTDRG